MTTEATLAHHLQAISESIDAVMDDYTEESVLFTQGGPIVGLAGIRAFFERFMGVFAYPPKKVYYTIPV